MTDTRVGTISCGIRTFYWILLCLLDFLPRYAKLRGLTLLSDNMSVTRCFLNITVVCDWPFACTAWPLTKNGGRVAYGHHRVGNPTVAVFAIINRRFDLARFVSVW